MKSLGKNVVTLFFTISLMGVCLISCDQTARNGESKEALTVQIDSTGISSFQFQNIQRYIVEDSVFMTTFKNHKVVWLNFNLRESASDTLKVADKGDDNLVISQFYDYTSHSAYELSASWNRELTDVRISKLNYQPRASLEEIDQAQQILTDSLELTEMIARGEVVLYEAMPSVVVTPSNERAIAVGIHSKAQGVKSSIYRITIDTRSIGDIRDLYHVDFSTNPCEIPANTSCPNNGSTGIVSVSIRQGSNTLWTFQVVRPAASSGHPGKGSGVELRHVYYRGKQVLYRAHVPILNVHYDQNACGPYRDWQNAETCFDCSAGTDIGSTGFRICKDEPKTFVDDGDDSGNFKGVAIFVKGQEVMLVSELLAGWYRYISEWTFHANGTIKPRFKFGGTENWCTCNLHFHHVYWRMDFDINGASNNRVRECKKTWFWWTDTYYTKESKSFRDRTKKWRIENGTDNCYEIIPGEHDGNGVGDSWAKGDVWVVRYRYNELEDGVGCVTCSGTTGSIQDNIFLTGENVDRSDVVVWYRSSFNHDAHTHSEEHVEIVGPDLIPIGNFGQ